MAIKTFNIEEDVYKQFSGYCKGNGISMSKQVELFMRSMIEDDPKVKKEFLERLEKIRKGKFIKVNSFAERYA
jgi:hypothetical protein